MPIAFDVAPAPERPVAFACRTLDGLTRPIYARLDGLFSVGLLDGEPLMRAFLDRRAVDALVAGGQAVAVTEAPSGPSTAPDRPALPMEPKAGTSRVYTPAEAAGRALAIAFTKAGFKSPVLRCAFASAHLGRHPAHPVTSFLHLQEWERDTLEGALDGTAQAWLENATAGHVHA